MARSRASRASIEDFNAVYQADANFKYPEDIGGEVAKSRDRFRGKLFFDRLLETIKIDGKKVYPPKNNKELRKLYTSIVQSDAQEHVKQSLIFYLLKDLEILPGKDVATQFAEDCYLPNKFWTFIEGIHSLDRLQFEPAMENLTSPSLTPTYSEEILAALLYAEKDELALAYYQTVSPSLANHELLIQYFSMLCKSSITEAFYFSRTQPHSKRRELLELLIDQSFRALDGKQRADQGVEMIDLPFDRDEEAWFENFLLRVTQGRNYRYSADVVMMRRIATGKLAQAKEDFHTLNLSNTGLGGVTWENVMDGLDKGMGPRNGTEIYEHD